MSPGLDLILAQTWNASVNYQWKKTDYDEF